MMLLLDFAVARLNRSGGKKNHGDHSNNNTDREYLSVSKTILTENTSRSVIRIVPKFEKSFNNKDSTEIRKTIKDSDKIGIF